MRLNPEKEICERLLAVAEDIRLAQISGLGAVDWKFSEKVGLNLFRFQDDGHG